MAFARLLMRTLLVLLILLVVIGLLIPSSGRVERHIEIDASPAKVFPQVNSMRAFHAWSPWSALDPNTKYSFEGPESGIGSKMTWGREKENIGAGSQEIIRSTPDSEVVTDLNFGEDLGGRATFLLSPNEHGGTHIIWRFDAEFGWNLFDRYFGLILDGLLGGSYQDGLKTLKHRVESLP